MMARNHMMIGTAATLTLVAAHVVRASPSTFGMAILGSLLPDLDSPFSMIGRPLPFLSWPLYRTIGHRTFTHGLPCLFLLTAIAYAFVDRIGYPGPVLAFLAGYALHILADMPTGGCAVLYPVQRRRFAWWPYLTTGTLAESLLALLITGAFLFEAYRLAPTSLMHWRHLITFG